MNMSVSTSMIKPLPQDVINRIAAGEVIQRPSSALKELIENSIDANATRINISLLEGGLKKLDIVDDGCGVWKNDFDNICMRFTTSKLKEIDDLQNMETFGFRGEALASISLVSHVTIQSRRMECEVGYSCQYKDTKPLAPPVPCACNVGTRITYEDLFYNLPTRSRSIRNTTEEYIRCLELIQQYAIQYASIAFTCKKHNSTTADVSTSGSPHSSTGMTVYPADQNISLVNNRGVIEKLYGRSVARELVEMHLSKTLPINMNCNALISNANYAYKKNVFILFINGRLVACNNLKKALQEVYADLLPRGSKPWMFISLHFPTNRIDVNVHPTKKEVKFLYEETIVSILAAGLRETLRSHDTSRTFDSLQGSTLHPSVNPSLLLHAKYKPSVKRSHEDVTYEEQMDEMDVSKHKCTTNTTSTHSKSSDNPIKVRTDVQQSYLHSFIVDSAAIDASSIVPHINTQFTRSSQTQNTRLSDESPQNLFSIKRLLTLVENRGDPSLSKEVVESVFVGAVNFQYALLQHQKKLLLVNLPVLVKECIYQSMLHRIGGMSCFLIGSDEHPSLYTILLIAIKMKNSGWDPHGRHKNIQIEELAKELMEKLVKHSAMLEEYFSIIIEDGRLKALPSCCGSYFPAQYCIPTLVLRLAAQVDWEEELECLDAICRILADCYGQLPEGSVKGDQSSTVSTAEGRSVSEDDGVGEEMEAVVNDASEEDGGLEQQKVVLERLAQARLRTGKPLASANACNERIRTVFERHFYPMIRLNSNFYVPSSYRESGVVVELTNLGRLYRVFERC